MTYLNLTKLGALLDQLREARAEKKALQFFHRRYNQYRATVVARGGQLAIDILKKKCIRPVHQKFCADLYFSSETLLWDSPHVLAYTKKTPTNRFMRI